MNLDHRLNPLISLSSCLLPMGRSVQRLVTHRLDILWHSLIKVLMSSDELQIRQVRDVVGQVWWCIYDPVSDRSACFSSEAEVYACLSENGRVL
jgi:hypothetical protein